MSIKNINKIIGPSLLYIAAAVGVSHLVQSTRAGANFGFELIWVIFLAHFVKYPFYWIVPKYVNETKQNLLQGYKDLNNFSLYTAVTINFITMFIIQAAITTVTSGLLINLFPSLTKSVPITSSFIFVISILILWNNKSKLLNNVIKIIVILLTLTTITTAFIAFLNIPDTTNIKPQLTFGSNEKSLFILAFIGWMPAPMDVPIWQSIWTQKSINSNSTEKTSLIDFKIGYFGTAILALLFLAIGALVLFPYSTKLSNSAVGFTSQLVKMYTTVIGSEYRYFIIIASLTTMFSTALTCLDAFSRVMEKGFDLIIPKNKYKIYHFFLIFIPLITIIIQIFFIGDMKKLVDFATTLSFIISPIYAYLNYRLLFKLSNVPKHIFIIAKIGLVFFVIFTVYYLKTTFL